MASIKPFFCMQVRLLFSVQKTGHWQVRVIKWEGGSCYEAEG